MQELQYPFDPTLILTRKKALRKALLEKSGSFPIFKVAILGGSTTAEIKDIFELFLLDQGVKPEFYESSFNQFYEEALFVKPELKAFAPDVIYIHTSSANIQSFPGLHDSSKKIDQLVQAESARYKSIGDALRRSFSCPIIQNNFEWPTVRTLGNLDSSSPAGRVRFITALNMELARYANQASDYYINDIFYLSSWMGLARWHDPRLWVSFKYSQSYDAIVYLAHNLSGIVRALRGQSKKVLIVDLDNTLWGGTIGEDGIENLRLGKETAEGEAFLAWQSYLKGLKERGVLLAVSSKNDLEVAKQGLRHEEGLLRPEDFAAIEANWSTKPEQIRSIAKELRLGLDSFVFVDENPAERDIVRQFLPQVEVPEIGDDAASFSSIIDQSGFFEPARLTAEDLERPRRYGENAAREQVKNNFSNYDEYLDSLKMEADIGPFQPVHVARIAQLINKTNQFNLTARRYSLAEVQTIAKNPKYITLAGRLRDRFGDNGIVSVIIGRIEKDSVHIDLWLMSCRVLQRKMELAMASVLVKASKKKKMKKLIGYYSPTAKNAMTADFYKSLGWKPAPASGNGSRLWSLELSDKEKAKMSIPIEIRYATQ